jgi:integrase/recombinase XerD
MMAQLSQWLANAGLDPAQATPEVVQEFVQARRRRGYTDAVSRQGLGPLLGYLRSRGIIPPAVQPAVDTPVETLLAQFGDYLVGERGLAAKTVRQYVDHSRIFLRTLPDPLAEALAGLSASQVTAFLLAQCHTRSVGSAKAMVKALRSLLRFCHVEGHVPIHLAPVVPAVAGWTLSWLPRGVGADQVAKLLASCDRGRASGRRDYAVLMLLCRLGLRIGEVTALELDDVDWRGGQLLIRGKGRRRDALPLPVDVGEALVDYLHHARPSCLSRKVIITARAPRRAVSTSAVQQIVYGACARAGLPPISPHRLRHTVATELLLRRLAPAWPGGAA